MSELRLPPPGLDGTYSGSCTVCLQGTDTGLGFIGEPEYVMAGLQALGVDAPVASLMVLNHCEQDLGCRPGMVPDEDITLAFQLCAACASHASSSFVVAPVGPGMPYYKQRPDQRHR